MDTENVYEANVFATLAIKEKTANAPHQLTFASLLVWNKIVADMVYAHVESASAKKDIAARIVKNATTAQASATFTKIALWRNS